MNRRSERLPRPALAPAEQEVVGEVDRLQQNPQLPGECHIEHRKTDGNACPPQKHLHRGWDRGSGIGVPATPALTQSGRTYLVYVRVHRVVVVAFVAFELQLLVQNRVEGTEDLALKLKVLHDDAVTYKYRAQRSERARATPRIRTISLDRERVRAVVCQRGPEAFRGIILCASGIEYGISPAVVPMHP